MTMSVKLLRKACKTLCRLHTMYGGGRSCDFQPYVERRGGCDGLGHGH